jgi:hypothetical protein
MRRYSLLIIALAILVIGVGQVMADTIPVINTTAGRPVAAFDDTTGQVPTQPALQTLLNQIAPGTFNALTNQDPTAMWTAAAVPPNTLIVPVLSFEFDPQENATMGAFGMFSGDTTLLNTAQIFASNALPGNEVGGPYHANVVWQTNNSGVIGVYTPALVQISVTPFTNIPYNFFGFYADGDAGRVYTSDLLNNGGIQALAFNGSSFWVIAFEYQQPGSGTYDFNDLVVKVESISTSPIPEPGTLILVGLGLGIAGILGRRKSCK